MKKFAMAIAATFILASAAVGSAMASQLSDREIVGAIGGKKVVLSTRLGKLPMRYYPDKRVTADGTGSGLGRFFAPKETGRWWVKNDQLCQKWPTWYDGRTFCFVLTRSGPSSLTWVRDDGAKGTAQIF